MRKIPLKDLDAKEVAKAVSDCVLRDDINTREELYVEVEKILKRLKREPSTVGVLDGIRNEINAGGEIFLTKENLKKHGPMGVSREWARGKNWERDRVVRIIDAAIEQAKTASKDKGEG